MLPENSKLIKQFAELFQESRPAFKQQRVFERAFVFALGEIMTLSRHTTSQIILSLGYGQQDWSAWYRLFSLGRFNYEAASRQVFRRTLAYVGRDEWYVVAGDATQTPRSSRKMEGAHWLYDPSSPVFKRGIHIAQRWFHGSWLLPTNEQGYSRAIPLRWETAFTEKSQPNYGRIRKEWEGAVDFLTWLRENMRAAGRPEQKILFVGDGHYDTLPLWQNLPEGVVMLARSAKNRSLWHLPPAGARANRLYGERAPVPAFYWQERGGWQALDLLVRGRMRHLQVKVRGPFLRRGAPNRPLMLIIVRGKHRKGRRRRIPLPFLVNAVQDANGEWGLPLPLESLLLAAWQRWEIEVAHRELKSNLGLGEKQNWNPRAAVLSVQWSAWLYALLVLAAWLSWGLQNRSSLVSRWWRGGERWSFNTMWRAYRAALWGQQPSSPLPFDIGLTWEDWQIPPRLRHHWLWQAAFSAARA